MEGRHPHVVLGAVGELVDLVVVGRRIFFGVQQRDVALPLSGGGPGPTRPLAGRLRGLVRVGADGGSAVLHRVAVQRGAAQVLGRVPQRSYRLVAGPQSQVPGDARQPVCLGRCRASGVVADAPVRNQVLVRDQYIAVGGRLGVT